MSLQGESEGMVSTMVVEKQKLDNKVKELKERVQVKKKTIQPRLQFLTSTSLKMKFLLLSVYGSEPKKLGGPPG